MMPVAPAHMGPLGASGAGAAAGASAPAGAPERRADANAHILRGNFSGLVLDFCPWFAVYHPELCQQLSVPIWDSGGNMRNERIHGAYIYPRFSTEHQHSIEEQVDACIRRCRELGLTVLGVYADETVSGTKLSRRNFDRMMDDLRAGLA